ncbi:MAG TPA: family 43 glycosylhydrolase [Clostridiales bacterium]|nr:family 43 glycosylhydrolase [Clostridiales bacterium]
MKYICNPISMEYKYQFIDEYGKLSLAREAADPTLVSFKGKYLLFPSMAGGFLSSDDLVEWEFHPLKDVPVYDYAPDACVIGDYLYFSASNAGNCSFFRTKDPFQSEFEEIKGSFPFWDPNLFADDDSRIYLFWGCSNVAPIYGVELNPEDMAPKSEPVELISAHIREYGFERAGENHIPPQTPEQIEAKVQGFLSTMPEVPEEQVEMIRKYFGNDPYIEGAWINKHNNRYYLQYSFSGTHFNVYGDGVYVSDHPLGPYTLQRSNPYSYQPGGFLPGAGHGSTIEDRFGNLWHIASMRISVNQQFERRVGLWPAGYDKDGELFCNTGYGDWPRRMVQGTMDPWAAPEWMLLSYKKPAKASSFEEGRDASKATDENVQTWWRAATNHSGEWLEIDLQHNCDVRAIQINFADQIENIQIPEGVALQDVTSSKRHIEDRKLYTRWILEGSLDGKEYFVIEDKSDADTDLSHDLVVREEGIEARYIRCTVNELPYRQNANLSGLRVFGIGEGELPKKPKGIKTKFLSGLDLLVSWDDSDAVGVNVVWGYSPDKLYHSYMVFGTSQVNLGAIIKDQPLYLRLDAFNERGITEGDSLKVV